MTRLVQYRLCNQSLQFVRMLDGSLCPLDLLCHLGPLPSAYKHRYPVSLQPQSLPDAHAETCANDTCTGRDAASLKPAHVNTT